MGGGEGALTSFSTPTLTLPPVCVRRTGRLSACDAPAGIKGEGIKEEGSLAYKDYLLLLFCKYSVNPVIIF